MEQTVCTLRVFTNQKIDGLIATELYSFVINKNCDIENIKHKDLFGHHTKHHETGEKIEPEPNVIYCDVFGGRNIG